MRQLELFYWQNWQTGLCADLRQSEGIGIFEEALINKIRWIFSNSIKDSNSLVDLISNICKETLKELKEKRKIIDYLFIVNPSSKKEFDIKIVAIIKPCDEIRTMSSVFMLSV